MQAVFKKRGILVSQHSVKKGKKEFSMDSIVYIYVTDRILYANMFAYFFLRDFGEEAHITFSTVQMPFRTKSRDMKKDKKIHKDKQITFLVNRRELRTIQNIVAKPVSILSGFQ